MSNNRHAPFVPLRAAKALMLFSSLMRRVGSLMLSLVFTCSCAHDYHCLEPVGSRVTSARMLASSQEIAEAVNGLVTFPAFDAVDGSRSSIEPMVEEITSLNPGERRFLVGGRYGDGMFIVGETRAYRTKYNTTPAYPYAARFEVTIVPEHGSGSSVVVTTESAAIVIDIYHEFRLHSGGFVEAPVFEPVSPWKEPEIRLLAAIIRGVSLYSSRNE